MDYKSNPQDYPAPQSYPPPPQAYPPQSYPAPQVYPPQAQVYPPQGYSQAYSPQIYPPQAYPQSYPYPQQGQPMYMSVPGPSAIPMVISNNNNNNFNGGGGCSCGGNMVIGRYIGPTAMCWFIILFCVCPVLSCLPFCIPECQDAAYICTNCGYR